MTFATRYPLIAEIARNFADGNDYSVTENVEYYYSALENSGESLDAIEAEAGKMDSLQREVIIRGVLPAEASYLTYDEESLSKDFPLVGKIYYILAEACDNYENPDE